MSRKVGTVGIAVAFVGALLVVAIVGGQRRHWVANGARSQVDSPDQQPESSSGLAVIAGRVVDRASDAPLAGARVTCWLSDGRRDQLTDANGLFRMELPAIPTGLTANYMFVTDETQLVGRANIRDVAGVNRKELTCLVVRLDLLRRITIRARILTRDGRPLSRCCFAIHNKTESDEHLNLPASSRPSDQNGFAELTTMLPYGHYGITVSHDHYHSSEEVFDFETWSPDFRWECQLVSDDYPRVRGRVLLAGNLPAKRACVVMFTFGEEDGATWSTRKNVVAGADGTFEFTLTQDGEVELAAIVNGYQPATVKLGLGRIDGGDKYTEILVVEPRAGKTVRGVIVDPDGKPVPDATMRLIKGETGSRDPEGSVLIPVAKDGSYELVLYPGELYWIKVEHESFKRIRMGELTAETFDGGPLKFQEGRE